MSFYVKITILGGFPVSRFCFLGVLFQIGFSPKAVQPEALVFGKNPRTHLEVQRSFGDEGTFQERQNHEFERFHYSVRQKIGDARSISTQNMFPLHSVVSKRPESQYGAKYCFL